VLFKALAEDPRIWPREIRADDWQYPLQKGWGSPILCSIALHCRILYLQQLKI